MMYSPFTAASRSSQTGVDQPQSIPTFPVTDTALLLKRKSCIITKFAMRLKEMMLTSEIYLIYLTVIGSRVNVMLTCAPKIQIMNWNQM